MELDPSFTDHTRLSVHRPSVATPGSSGSSRKNSGSDEGVLEFGVSSLTYRDFFPRMTEEGGTFSSPAYEEFGILVTRANEWLLGHREFEVLNVECVEILTLHNTKTVDPNKASYFETMKDWTEFVRGLRMWLIPALTKDKQSKGGFLRYFDVVPECTHAGIVSIDYSRLSVLVEAMNEKLRNNPINGDVLAVQTLTLRFHSGSSQAVDSARTCFSLHGHKQKIRLYFLRVFYMEFGEEIPGGKVECMEEIGIADFVPQIMRHQTTARQHIEPLSSVITRAGDWFIRYQEDDHPGLRIVNIQTVILHVKDNKNTDTQQTFYMSSGDGEKFLYELRFIRLIYARQTRLDLPDSLSYPRVFMKLFCPTQLTGVETHSKRQPKFNNLPDLVGRIQEWISADHPPIIGIETHGYSTYVGDEILITAESPYLYDQGHEDKFWIQSVRVYYEADYVESSNELPSPGRRDRRGSSVYGMRKTMDQKTQGTAQGAWPPLSAGSSLAPETLSAGPGHLKVNHDGRPLEPSPRSTQRRSTREDIGKDDFKGLTGGKHTPKSDKDCIIS